MDIEARLKRDWHSLAIVVLSVLAVLLFTLGCFASYHHLRDQRQATDRQEAQRMLLVFEAHSTRLFDYVDSYMKAIRVYHAEHGKSANWQRFVTDTKSEHAEFFFGIVNILDRDGMTVYQSEFPPEKMKTFGSMSALDHYQYFMKHPGDSLFVGATRLGKITGKNQFRMARPLLKGGAFDGEVLISLLPEHIIDFYRSVSLGAHSRVSMMTLEPKLIAHHPPVFDMYGQVIADMKNPLGIDIERKTGGSVLGVVDLFDKVRRDIYYKRIADYPVAILVGIAEQDLDDALGDTRRNLILLASGFALMSLIGCGLVLRMIAQDRRLAQSDAASQVLRQHLQASEAFKEIILNSVVAEIAVIDRTGSILMVNQPWLRFALENSPEPGQPTPHTEVGANYLSVCQSDSDQDACNGIRAVLEGRLPSFSMDYPCHSPTQQRWFTMVVTPLNQPTVRGAVVTHTNITKVIQAQQALQAQHQFDEALIATAQVMVLLLDPQGKILSINPYMETICGYGQAEVQGKDWFDTFLPQHVAASTRVVFQGAIDDIQTKGNITPIIHKSGQERLIEWYDKTLKDSQGVTLGLLATGQDVTERIQIATELRLAATTFETQQAIVITDANQVILRVNRAFLGSTGYTTEELVGQTARIYRSARYDANFYRQMWQSIRHTGGWQGEIWNRRKSGQDYPTWLTISAMKDDAGGVTHYVGAYYDMTERKQAEEKINSLAYFDQLTGLPNRTLLHDRLAQAMVACSRSDSYGALMFIDLDNFKSLNDTLGHDVGDLLLKQVARRLTQCLREVDTVARLGGDEFVVVLAGISTDERAAATDIEALAVKILTSLSQPYQLGNVPYRSSASIGVTVFKGDVASMDDLLKQADMAMYTSKQAGRNAVRFFDARMESVVKERVVLEEDLRRAIDDGQFLLHYQAQVTGDGALTGAEVLLRWQHPQRGMVSPESFIPLAEETGLIQALGYWVLKTACSQLAAWQNQTRFSDLTVAVNVSACQFSQAGFVDQVLEVLADTGANPQRLQLELTESVLAHNVEDLIKKMVTLKAHGVGFSLDDFGTGFSSLSYLAQLPLNQLKIDRSFVQNIPGKKNPETIVRTILSMGQGLGMNVIAEGVETEVQRKFLETHGCHFYQGYLFARPLPIDEFEKMDISYVRKIPGLTGT